MWQILMLLEIIKKIIFFIASCLFCMPSIASDAPPITVKVAVNESLTKNYWGFLEKKQKPAIEFTSMDMVNTNRGFISLVVLEQALHKAGLSVNIELVVSPNPKRSQRLLQSADALISFKHTATNSAPEGLLTSSVLIDSKDILRGIYGLKSNHLLMKAKTLDDLKKLSAVTNLAWKDEVKFLEEIVTSKLYFVSSYKNIFNLITHRNIDFTILALNKKNGSFEYKFKQATLVPVPGILIQLQTPFRFLISKNHRNSQRIFQALEKGLSLMREQGLLKKYYQNLFLTKTELQYWKIINTDQADLE